MLKVDQADLLEIKNILHNEMPEYEVWAFGSRVKNKARPSSDLDLAIITKEPLEFTEIGNLKEAFSKSDISYRVDILEWSGAPDWLKQDILKQHEIIQKPNN